MKKLFISLLAIGALTIYSCSSDPCEGKSCNGNGSTVPSSDNKSCSCDCFTGYLGANCDSVDMNLLAGTYSVNEPGSNPSTYSVTAQTTGNQILFTNFANVWDNKIVTANVNGTGISINRFAPNNDNYYVETKETGTVRFSSGKVVISMIYKVTTPSNIVKEYEITMSQQ